MKAGRRIRRLGIPLLVVCGIIGAVVGLVEASAPAAPAPVTGPFALGINEAVSVPRRLLARGRLGPEVLDAHLAADAERARGLGARLVRGHTGGFPPMAMSDLARDPSARASVDAWVRAVQGAGLEAVGMVSPWPGNQTAEHTDRYVPEDLEAYRRYVRELVERYDADGIDDMPLLSAPIRYWEVDNEPDLKNTDPPRGQPRRDAGNFCTPAEYAAVLIASAAGIREAQPEARVLIGGIYRPFADAGEGYLSAVLAVDGARAAFDILSLHTYAEDDGSRLVRGIGRARALAPDRPVWVTETSFPSTDGEEAQARMVVTLVARAAAAGAERLFWHSLSDPPASVQREGPGGGPKEFSLFRTLDPRTGGAGDVAAKQAAGTFAHLAARLATDDLAGALPDGDGAVRLRSGAVLLYAGERPVSKGGTNLLTGAALPAGTSAAAPAWLE